MTRASARLLAALLLVLALPACSDDEPSPEPSTGTTTAKLTVDGQERTYRLYRPASAAPEAPLVIVLHGAAGTGRQAEESYGWDEQADQGGFLVAYPDGVNRSWNASDGCCGVAARDDVDDLAFMRQLVGAVPGADPGRVFATGISNGAILAYRMACETDLLAGIGPVAGTMLVPCDSPEPLSVIAVHGTADQTIPYTGGPGKRSNDGTGRIPVKIDGPPVPEIIDTWRKTDDCAAPGAATTKDKVTTSVATCPDNRAVELITVAGAGHQWPGGKSAPVAEKALGLDAPSQALDATAVIWAFFAAHSPS